MTDFAARLRLTAALAAAAAIAGCAPRWGRHPSQLPPPAEGEFAVDESTRPARPPKPARKPMPFVDPEARKPLYYSDLGPDAVDVSNYPVQQRYNYAVYSEVCSRCHTLARSINAPIASRGFWELYVLSMRVEARAAGRRMTKEERTAVVDFLDYDSRERKVARHEEFQEQTDELKRRFEPYLREQLGLYQETAQPALLPRAP